MTPDLTPPEWDGLARRRGQSIGAGARRQHVLLPGHANVLQALRTVLALQNEDLHVVPALPERGRRNHGPEPQALAVRLERRYRSNHTIDGDRRRKSPGEARAGYGACHESRHRSRSGLNVREQLRVAEYAPEAAPGAGRQDDRKH